MRKYIINLCATAYFLSLVSTALAQTSNKPATITFNYDDLVTIRKSIQAGQEIYKAPYTSLLNTAGKLLTKAPEKVTDGDIPPSGNKHDFFTIGKFSWPNPNTPNGMPYIRGDGKYNEEAFGDRYDLSRLQRTAANINNLTLAWFYTQDEKYARKATDLIKVWFIDTATRMNPNMKFGSAQPGVVDGMAIGIIFTVVLIETTDHMQLLRQSKSWDEVSDKALKQWFKDYKTWLQTSEFGKQESGAKNNHGTWYSAQLLAYSLFSGNNDGVAEQFELAKLKIDSQITPDGRLPLEMRRVEGFHYFIYGLKGFNVLANGLKQFGYDLWSYKTSDGKNLSLPYQYIIPYINGEKTWTTGGSIDLKESDGISLLKQAAVKYNLPRADKAIAQLRDKVKPTDIKLLYLLK